MGGGWRRAAAAGGMGPKAARRNKKQVQALRKQGRSAKRGGRTAGHHASQRRKGGGGRGEGDAEEGAGGDAGAGAGVPRGVEEFLGGGWEQALGDGSDGGAGGADSLEASGSEPDSSASEPESEESEDVEELLDRLAAAKSESSESESSSSEDGGEGESDGEEGEGSLPKAKSTKAKEGSKHKATLDALREKDPEFYKYLEQTDKRLLDFNAGEDEDESDSGGEDDAAAAGLEGDAGRVVGTSDLAKWREAAAQGGLGALKRLLAAYRAACHLGDEGQQGTFALEGPGAYNEAMLFTLMEADRGFRAALSLNLAEKAPKALAQSKRWKKVEPLVKSFVGNTAHALAGMRDGAALAFTLRRVRASADLLGPLPRLAKKLLKVSLKLFADGVGDEKRDRTVRVQAALLVRALADCHADLTEEAMRGFVRAFQSVARQGTQAARPSLRLMADCVVEVLGVDLGAAYQQAFAALRALAMQLRDALSMKSKDAYLQVYCWQTVHSLDLWERVLSAYGGGHGGRLEGGSNGGPLKPLVYPLTQLLLGAARLVPTTRYFPLRLHLAQTLNRLAHSSGAFIPVAPLLVEVLQFSELSQRPSGGQGHNHDMDGILKVSKSALRTVTFQEQCVGRAVQLLAEHLGQWATHVAFPELAHPTALQLKRFLKLSPVEKFRRQVKQLLEAMDANSEFIMRRRHGVEFSPKDSAEVKRFQADPALAKASPFLRYARAVAQQAKQGQVAKATDTIDFKLNPATREGSDSEEEGGGAEADMDLLPKKKSAKKKPGAKTRQEKNMKRTVEEADLEGQEDIVEDLVLSSDEEDDVGGTAPLPEPSNSSGEEEEEERPRRRITNKKSKKQRMK